MRPVIFFVDDDAHFANGMERSLRHLRERWEMRFFTAPDTLLREASTAEVSVIVADWEMPSIDGPALCARLRDLWAPKGPAPYMILLTGKQSPEHAAHALEAGADDFLRKPVDRRELVARIQVGLRLIESQRELRRAKAALEKLALTDELTGLSNRRAGVQVLEGELARVDRDLEALTVAMVDLDHFKQINDSWGHPAGDRVLEVTARALLGARRRYDTVARWGGEEFLVICPNPDPGVAPRIGERIRGEISAQRIELPSGDTIGVTASVGAATVPSGACLPLEEILAAADAALYEAKENGRNCVVCRDLGTARRERR